MQKNTVTASNPLSTTTSATGRARRRGPAAGGVGTPDTLHLREVLQDLGVTIKGGKARVTGIELIGALFQTVLGAGDEVREFQEFRDFARDLGPDQIDRTGWQVMGVVSSYLAAAARAGRDQLTLQEKSRMSVAMKAAADAPVNDRHFD